LKFRELKPAMDADIPASSKILVIIGGRPGVPGEPIAMQLDPPRAIPRQLRVGFGWVIQERGPTLGLVPGPATHHWLVGSGSSPAMTARKCPSTMEKSMLGDDEKCVPILGGATSVRWEHKEIG